YVSEGRSEVERTLLANLVFKMLPIHQGHWTRYSANEGLPGSGVSGIVFGSDGAAWLATWAGVARFDGREFLTLTRADGLPDNLVDSIGKTTDGTLWLETLQGVVGYDPNSPRPNIRKLEAPSRLSNSRGGQLVMRATPDGAMWLRTAS